MLQITDTLAIDESELRERFVRSSGPGGQNVNKVATAVELQFDIAASSLPNDVKARLASIAGHRVHKGVLHIDSRVFRSQAKNRDAARERLIALLRRAATPPKRRRPTKTPKVAKERRIEAKKRRGEIKRGRQKSTND